MTAHWPTTAFRKSIVPSNPVPFESPLVQHPLLTLSNREGQYGQDIFTLRSTYFEQHPQAPIHMHWRRFKVSDIPLSTPEAFHAWLIERWNEKEALSAAHAKTGRFPSSINQGESFTTEVKLGRWWEICQLGAVLAPLIAGVFVVVRYIG